MPTALPLATAFTDASTTEAQEKTALGNLRASLAEIGDPMARAGAIQNLSLVFTVAANALTCNVKTRAGAAPSSTDPVTAAMRNATLSSGDFNVRNITATLSLVISSGSTLGHLSATASFIYWYLIDNAGALELAASTTYFGTAGIVTTTAEGGAGAADSATVMYSTTARSSVPFICVGRTTDTQTTAGTWTAVPSTVELAPLDMLTSGTWTPSVGGTATYINQTGTWTKIGRMVFIKGRLEIDALGTGSPSIISGLPFTSTSSLARAYIGVVRFGALAEAVVSLWGEIAASSASVKFQGLTAAAIAHSSVITVFQSGSTIEFSGSYEAAA